MSDPLTIALLIAVLAVQCGGFTALWLRASDPACRADPRPTAPGNEDVH